MANHLPGGFFGSAVGANDAASFFVCSAAIAFLRASAGRSPTRSSWRAALKKAILTEEPEDWDAMVIQ
jgi:hypothetical protein